VQISRHNDTNARLPRNESNLSRQGFILGPANPRTKEIALNSRSIWRTLARRPVLPAIGRRYRRTPFGAPTGRGRGGRATLLSRAARRAGLDRNPMRRKCDRVQAWLMLALTAAFLIAGPIVAWQTGRAAYVDAEQAAGIARQHRFPAEAVLEKDALGAPPISQSIPANRPAVPARWKAPDGAVRIGEIVPSSPARAGTVVQIWTDAWGNWAAPPPPDADASRKGLDTALIALVGLSCATVFIRSTVRRSLLRRQLAAWQLEWALVEPRWRGR
jgi:hypothetical protein